MSDENLTGVRATTADEEAVMFQQSWIKAEKQITRLREENARLREVLKEVSVCLDGDRTGNSGRYKPWDQEDD